MSKNFLNSSVKEFIVIQLAERQRPSDVAASVKEKFGIEIKRQTAHLYNPTHIAGKRLSGKLKQLFDEKRAEYQKKQDAETDLIIQEKINRMYPHRRFGQP